MNNRALIGGFCLFAVLMAMSGFATAQEVYQSPLALAASPDGATLYVCAHTANRVVLVDTASGDVTGEFATPEPPTAVAVHPDGSPVLVTTGGPNGFIHAFSPDGSLLYSIPVGHTPMAPVLHPATGMLLVCNRFESTVSFIDIDIRAELARIPVPREPVAAAITQDGARLYVANHLPAGPADGDYTAAEISVIDVLSRTVSSTIPLPNGSSSLRGMVLSPDGAHVYVTHLLSRYQLPTTQLERGWMNTNALSIIDANSATLINTVLLDDVDLGASNPWGVACTPDGSLICVTHAGTHEISVIDRAGLHDKLNRIAAGERVSDVSRTAQDVPNDLSFLVGLRHRIKLEGNGPRGIVMLGNTAYAAEYFTDSIGVVDVTQEIRPRPRSLSLAPETPVSIVRQGEIFFNDADLCFQHWQSCASCHPDARVDGLNWDLLNDGIGNPKNTKNMLLSHVTPPAMSLGVRDTAEMAVRAGIRHIQFAVRPEEDAVAIDEYMKALTPEPSPYLVNGELSEAAKRGKTIFMQAGCAECHPAPLYTTLQHYNVGTATQLDKEDEYDTPTLIESWRTAPYLHDGRAATMREVLTKFNPNDLHGKTSDLSEEQLDDLVAYVLSL